MKVVHMLCSSLHKKLSYNNAAIVWTCGWVGTGQNGQNPLGIKHIILTAAANVYLWYNTT